MIGDAASAQKTSGRPGLLTGSFVVAAVIVRKGILCPLLLAARQNPSRRTPSILKTRPSCYSTLKLPL